VGEETVLSQIIEMVKKAQMDKPKLQSLADKISAVFVPLVVIVSLATFAISYWAVGMDFQAAMMHSIAVMVIACPCALGLAIPTAVVVAVGRVAKNGILIKGASTIQKLVAVKYMAFDKTGTLTTGEFKVNNFNAYGNDESLAKAVLYGLELHSSHPIARSLVGSLESTVQKTFTAITEEKGFGISGTDENGDLWKAGSFRIVEDMGVEQQHDIYLIKNGTLFASLDLEDQVKEGVAEAITYFKRFGVIPVLISGDREAKCRRLADAVGIDEVYAEKLPAEKLVIIEQLEKTGNVAMVGDGINDAPALAKASVGISLSNATQVAIQSAQVILLKGNLKLLTRAHGISRITLKVIKQNLFWAFFYNVIAIPIAAAGYLDPMVAAATMALSDVVVVLNSLRLRSRKIS
jgi:Cu+-exporting ATPase